MADHILKAGDIPNGQEGKVYGNISGNVEFLMEVKNITATTTLEKTDVRTLGKRGTQHKQTGWSGKGSMTIYMTTSRYAAWMDNYNKTGIMEPFRITIFNHDPDTSIGTQTVNLYDVLIDSVDLAKLDVDNAILDLDVDFTFDDFELLDKYKNPMK